MAGSQTSRWAGIKPSLLFPLLTAAMLLAGASCQPRTSFLPTAEAPLPRKASPTPQPLAATREPTPPVELALPTPSPTEVPAPLVFIPGSSRYTLPPTLHFISPDAATIVFEIDRVADLGLLTWETGTDPRAGVWMPISSASGVQTIELTDLAPATEYLAAILEAPPGVMTLVPTLLGEIWDPLRIHTLPEDGFPVRIAVMGDSGFGQAITQAMAQAMADRVPDLFIHTGDLVYNANQEETPAAAYQFKWFQTLSPILHEAAILPVVGNHEMYDDALWQGQPYYYHAFPVLDLLESVSDQAQPQPTRRDWYRLVLGDIQLLFLNTQVLFGGEMRSEQDQWLEERLSDPAYTASIVVFHVPPYTSGRHRLDGTAVVRSWVPLFEAYNVPLVLSGHDHNYEHLFQNGVNYVVSGGGSSILYEQGIPLTISQLFFKQSHYLVIDILDEQLQLSVISSDGSLLDTFEIDLN